MSEYKTEPRKLTELNPAWMAAYEGRQRVGMWFDCPCGRGEGCEIGGRSYVTFANPPDGEGPIGGGTNWTRTGETFEALSLSPSLHMVGHWHGEIRDGVVTSC